MRVLLSRPVWRLAAEGAAVFLLAVAFYSVHLDFTRIQSGSDYTQLFWPMKELRVRALAEAGAVPLWNPYVFLGTPAAATMQYAYFYPPEWLLAWLSPAFPAMAVGVLLHNALAVLGGWALGRFGARFGAAPSALCGVAFGCSAWFWGHQEHINQVAAAAYLPWLLLALWRFARGDVSPARFVAVYGGLSALQFLAGHPQSAFYTHMAAGALLVVFALRGWRRKEAALHRLVLRLVVAFALAGALAGSLSAVQLLPAMELSGHSYRQFSSLDFSYALNWSMPPDVLVTYLRPHAFGSYMQGFGPLDAIDYRAYNEYGLFVGVPVLALGLAGLALAWRERRRWLAGALALGIGGTLVLAMGGNVSPTRIASGEFTEFPPPAFGASGAVMRDALTLALEPSGRWQDLSPLEALLHVVPTARSFRVPARVTLVTALLWGLLGGLGLECLLKWARRAPGGWVAPTLGVVAVGASWLALYLPSREEKYNHPQGVDNLLLAWEEDRELRTGASLDNRLFRLTRSDADITVAEREERAETPLIATYGTSTPTIHWLRLRENMNAVARFPSIEGYEEGLSPTVRTKDFLMEYNRHLRHYRPDLQFLALLGVGRVMADLPVDLELMPPVPDESRHHRYLVANPQARGAAFWRDAAEGIAFERLDGPFQRGGPVRGQRAIERNEYGSAPRWGEEWPLLTTDVTNPNRVVVRMEEAGPVRGDAVLAMGAFPGWHVGGKPVQWLSAAHGLIPAEAFEGGEAVLQYEPESYRVGLFLSAVGLAVLVGLLVGAARRG